MRSTLISQMDIHQARTEPTSEEIKAKMDIQDTKGRWKPQYTLSGPVRGDHQISGGRCPAMCHPKDTGNLTRRLMKCKWTYRQYRRPLIC